MNYYGVVSSFVSFPGIKVGIMTVFATYGFVALKSCVAVGKDPVLAEC